jgi:hypothetical protein
MIMNSLQFKIFSLVTPHFASSIETGLKELLEKKHLYQNVKIELPDTSIIEQAIKDYRSGSTPSPHSHAQENTSDFISSSLSKTEWTIKNPSGRRSLPLGGSSELVYASVEFVPPTVKLFCRVCERIEAYNFLHGQDLLSDFRKPDLSPELENKQIFSLEYQCQSCKSIPEILLVQREKLKVIQCGRSPMEEIDIPSYLPKQQKKFFSDAIIAFNSGQVLAGNFLLRTFIEQYVRSLSSFPNSQNIEALFTEYHKTLPDDFKQRFPSLQSVYDKLSNDLHMATASENTFQQTRADIEKHFKAKEVFEV